MFERILVRLENAAPGMWVLKGGVALEVRLRDRSRTTKDLDMVTRWTERDGEAIREHLLDALDADAERDRFVFAATLLANLEPDSAGRPGWRYSVEARLAGRMFTNIRIDIVARPEEVSGTERLALPNSLAFDDFPFHEFETVSSSQHFAEKLHAMTRTYSGDNSRTRDLLDLVLLIESGLVAPDSVWDACDHLFRERGTHPTPISIPDVPLTWDLPYRVLASEVGVEADTLPVAMVLVRDFWALVRLTTASEGPA